MGEEAGAFGGGLARGLLGLLEKVERRVPARKPDLAGKDARQLRIVTSRPTPT
jgi:hypothetical protein